MELSYEYCPFCGHKFEEDKKIKKENKTMKRVRKYASLQTMIGNYCRQYILLLNGQKHKQGPLSGGDVKLKE